MFRKLLATTAITAVMTAGALAQDEQKPQDATQNQPLFSDEQNAGIDTETGFFEADASQILASNLIGQTVYNGATDDAEMVGDINDVVMSPEGKVEAAVIGVGGFLGIGEKEVAVEFEKISWVDREDGRWLIIDSSKEELESAPDFDRTALLPEQPTDENVASSEDAGGTMATDPAMEEDADMAASEDQPADAASGEQMDTAATEEPADAASEDSTDMAASEDKPADAASGEQMDTAATEDEPADAASEDSADMAASEDQPTDAATDEQMAASEDQPADEQTDEMAATDEGVDTEATAAINPDEWQPASNEQLSAENLIGTSVYGANDEDIGEIGDVIVTADGNLEAYIVDVGGFLGLGEKPVALDASKLEVMIDADGELHIRTGFTQEQLEGQPSYDEQAYRENRDDILLR